VIDTIEKVKKDVCTEKGWDINEYYTEFLSRSKYNDP